MLLLLEESGAAIMSAIMFASGFVSVLTWENVRCVQLWMEERKREREELVVCGGQVAIRAEIIHYTAGFHHAYGKGQKLASSEDGGKSNTIGNRKFPVELQLLTSKQPRNEEY